MSILADAQNMQNLHNPLEDLQADVIAVPPFNRTYLDLGQAVHFRCGAPGAEGMRVDVMSRMQGVDDFHQLWGRRTTLMLEETEADLLSLPDLVQAKKTQRVKDWPMIQRLVEAHWYQFRQEPTPERVLFWLRECRTATLVMELTERFPQQAEILSPKRRAVERAQRKDLQGVEVYLENEQKEEMNADKAYYQEIANSLQQESRPPMPSSDERNSTKPL